MDGRFDSSDLVAVFRAAEYEDGLNQNSGWAEGDWNGDGDFTTLDLTEAFQSGGYVTPAKPLARLIPAAIDLDDRDADKKNKSGLKKIAERTPEEIEAVEHVFLY